MSTNQRRKKDRVMENISLAAAAAADVFLETTLFGVHLTIGGRKRLRYGGISLTRGNGYRALLWYKNVTNWFFTPISYIDETYELENMRYPENKKSFNGISASSTISASTGEHSEGRMTSESSEGRGLGGGIDYSIIMNVVQNGYWP